MSKRTNVTAAQVVAEPPRGGPTVLSSIPKSAVPRRPVTAFAPACATFRRHLKTAGLKFTTERAMVLDAVLDEPGLFDAERVVDNLKAVGHRGSRATVYRTLSHLHDAGLLKQVHFGGSQTYYEVVVAGETKDYLVCVETGRVVAFQSERLKALSEEICREFGFDPIHHQLHIFGVSPEARAVAEATAEK